jgi:hypothetical protein
VSRLTTPKNTAGPDDDNILSCMIIREDTLTTTTHVSACFQPTIAPIHFWSRPGQQWAFPSGAFKAAGMDSVPKETGASPQAPSHVNQGVKREKGLLDRCT